MGTIGLGDFSPPVPSFSAGRNFRAINKMSKSQQDTYSGQQLMMNLYSMGVLVWCGGLVSVLIASLQDLFEAGIKQRVALLQRGKVKEVMFVAHMRDRKQSIVHNLFVTNNDDDGDDDNGADEHGVKLSPQDRITHDKNLASSPSDKDLYRGP